MSVDVLGYLEGKGLHLRRASGWEYHLACVYCGEDLGSRGRLYINVDPDAEIPGLHKCFLCEAKGSLTTLKRHFGDHSADTDTDDGNSYRAEILHAAAEYYHDQLAGFDDVVAYLHGPHRGWSTETINTYRIGYAPMEFVYDLADETTTVRKPRALYQFLRREGYEPRDILATGLVVEHEDRLFDTFYGMVIIPYTTAGNVSLLRGRTWPYEDDDWKAWTGPRYRNAPSKYKTPPGNRTRLFNTDITWGTDEIAVCEGEADSILLTQLGYPAVGVPGANTWQDSWNGYLANMKRVWLVFDRDEAGEKGANRLVDRFGIKMRRIHLSPEGTKCDPTQWFCQQHHTTDEFEALLADAASGGLLVSVRDAITEFEHVQDQPGLKFNHELLDLMIEPGLQAGQILVLLSKSGTGKTLWLLNMMHRMRECRGQRDLRILFVSLEQTRGEWWDRARRIHRFYHLDSTEHDAAQWWDNHLLLVDRNRLTETQLRQVLDEFEYQMGQKPDLVCLDYLGYWGRGFRGEGYERTSAAVMALKAIAKDYRIPFLVPHQVSRIAKDGEEFSADAGRESGGVEETADFLLTLWSPDNLLGRSDEEKSGQLHMRIAKSRHGGRGVLLTLQFAPVSLVMVPQGDPLAARARQEFGWRQMYKDDWPRVLYRHHTGFEGHLATVPAPDAPRLL